MATDFKIALDQLQDVHDNETKTLRRELEKACKEIAFLKSHLQEAQQIASQSSPQRRFKLIGDWDKPRPSIEQIRRDMGQVQSLDEKRDMGQVQSLDAEVVPEDEPPVPEQEQEATLKKESNNSGGDAGEELVVVDTYHNKTRRSEVDTSSQVQEMSANASRRHYGSLAGSPTSSNLPGFTTTSGKHDRELSCMISPVSRARLAWDILALICLMVDLWTTPFVLLYLQDDAAETTFEAVNLVTTSFWVFDILLNLNTGFIQKDKLVMRRSVCIRKYIRSWFCIDLVATIPYDLLARAFIDTFDPSLLSVARFIKVTKALKILRLIRMARIVHLIHNMRRTQKFQGITMMATPFFKVMATLTAFAGWSHVHCCWLWLQCELEQKDGFRDAFDNYFKSFRWAWLFITTGNNEWNVPHSPNFYVFEMLVCAERVLAMTIFGGWAFTKLMVKYQEDMAFDKLKASTMSFFRQRNLKVETQLQVVYSLLETRAAQVTQRHFQQLINENLPEVLRRTVCEELWCSHLVSLGLINHLQELQADFVPELALVVREEILASKTLLFREWAPSLTAYQIMDGRLRMYNGSAKNVLPDFTAGMWLGEMALVGSGFRRRGTCIAKSLTRVMAVPGEAWMRTITKTGLEACFEQLKRSHLDYGLCGRCGVMGDHFSHACPHNHHVRSRQGLTRLMSHSATTKCYRKISNPLVTEGQKTEADQFTSFLSSHGLKTLKIVLEEKKVYTMEDFEALNCEELRDCLTYDDSDMCDGLDLLITLQEESREQARLLLNKDAMSCQHLIFLSHFKVEGGTEAALMRAELEQPLQTDKNAKIYQMFSTPVFLDSEDLANLEDLQRRVQKTHNLIVLLTQSVLLRPWVLVEIVTAVRHDVRVLPVKIQRAGSEFTFPTSEWYEDLLRGKVLDQSAEEFLLKYGITLQHVADALKQIFMRISLPYSPHRPETIRRAEVRSLLQQLRISTAIARVDSNEVPPQGLYRSALFGD